MRAVAESGILGLAQEREAQMTREVMPLALAAKRTLLGEQSIRRGIKAGTIEALKLGRDWYLPIEEVDRLAQEYPLENGSNG
jgi:hypothetical protein